MKPSSSGMRLMLLAVVGAAILVPSTIARVADVELPPANGVLDYQLGGAYTPAPEVDIIDRDRTDPAIAGKYNICYVNAFQTQPAESAAFATRYPDLIIKDASGRPIVDPNWPGEYILDISTGSKRVQLSSIVGAWIDGCADDGFQAVEADNLDSYLRSQEKFDESAAIDFATLLVRRAHDAGLAIGQKNGAEFVSQGKDQIGFDFAVTEECQKFDECGKYTTVYGNQVYEIEYTDNDDSFFPTACRAHGTDISVILRDRDVVPFGAVGYVYEYC